MSSHTPIQRGGPVLSLATATLAFWQLRRTWFLLLWIACGMVAAVVIVCAIPMLSDVMTTAGVRSALRTTPSGTELSITTNTLGLSTSVVHAVQQDIDPQLQQYLGTIAQPEQSALMSTDFSLPSSFPNATLTLYATSTQQARPHLGPIQGQSARTSNHPASELEVMITPETAKRFHAHVGSTIPLTFTYGIASSINNVTTSQSYTEPITAVVVGIFTITPANTAYWHGQDFNPGGIALQGTITQAQYTMLVSEDALLSLYDSLRTAYRTDAVRTTGYTGYTLLWYYRLNTTLFTSQNLGAMINRFANLRASVDSLYGDIGNAVSFDANNAPTFPYLTFLRLSGPTLPTNDNPSLLETFQSRVAVTRIPAGVFTLLILALILFFVSLMTTLLIDLQTDMIALLRSRGASGRQIFWALLLQCSALGVVALLIGPPLAIEAVVLLAAHVLPSTVIDALDIITRQPLLAIAGTAWYALAIVLVALLTMSLSLLVVARTDILLLRRESARNNKRPFWQRMNLDVITGVIALVGYALSLYVTSVGNILQGDAKVLIAVPLSMIAPFFLVVGCLFLFLRIFPFLLRVGARTAARGRGVVSLLAFAQIARAPRQSLRTILLLALATTFALFTLVYNATEAQHIQDIVSYQAGADFSANLLPASNTPAVPTSVLSQYRGIPGVLAASVGYADDGVGGTANMPIVIRAVDAGSFAQAVNWPSTQALQVAQKQLARLVALRPAPRQTIGLSDVVPALVDPTLLAQQHIQVGSFFTVKLNNVVPQSVQCLIVGVLGRIPTINTVVPTDASVPVQAGSILVDYQNYLSAYLMDAKNAPLLSGPKEPPLLNTLWLRTKDDATSLASVRTALSSSKYHVANFTDRRALTATLESDPLYLILYGILTIGTITALLLGLIGDVLVSWLSARTRVMNFVTLRALGSSINHVVSMLTWEQAIISLTGLLLGTGFGLLLVNSVLPNLTFTDLNSNMNSTQVFALQSALAAKIVVPSLLPVALLVLIGVYALALFVMVRVVLRPALSQALRVNED